MPNQSIHLEFVGRNARTPFLVRFRRRRFLFSDTCGAAYAPHPYTCGNLGGCARTSWSKPAHPRMRTHKFSQKCTGLSTFVARRCLKYSFMSPWQPNFVENFTAVRRKKATVRIATQTWPCSYAAQLKLRCRVSGDICVSRLCRMAVVAKRLCPATAFDRFRRENECRATR